MQKWILGAIMGFSLLITAVVLRYGLQPETIKIIRPSNFETPERLAQYIYSELFQEFLTSKTIAVGLDKNHPAFFDQTLDEIMAKMKSVNSTWETPFTKILLLDSLPRSRSKIFEKLKKENLNDSAIILSFVDLTGSVAAVKSENCEFHRELSDWLLCSKQQKLREMFAAKKVDLKKPIAIMEQIGALNYVVYLKP